MLHDRTEKIIASASIEELANALGGMCPRCPVGAPLPARWGGDLWARDQRGLITPIDNATWLCHVCKHRGTVYELRRLVLESATAIEAVLTYRSAA